MLPDAVVLDNDLRSPNNNSGLPRTRGSLCLSPVTTTIIIDNKRRSWCGTPSSVPTLYGSRRYGELGQFKPRSDAFLEPYLQGLEDRHSPGVGALSPSPPLLRIVPNLIPKPTSRSPSRESLVSSTGGSDASSEDSGDTGYGATCDISLKERLSRSHPIWFLPGIQRAGAFHLLQGKEEGCFIVRQSSQMDTMALSVRLPPDKGPYIEHYLIQSIEGQLGLETSDNRFDNMPDLIAHYANCCDELPVQLILPKSIREAKSRQQLSSLALLGQEFWRYSPPPSNACSPDGDLVLNMNPLTSSFKCAEPATPVLKDKPARPNTLNLLNKIDPNRNDMKLENSRLTPLMRSESATKTPPPPPPRWSKPTTPQNNFTVTTTVTFSVNAQSPRNELPSQADMQCDPKRLSPEGQCTSTVSSKGSLRRSKDHVNSQGILSPNSSILSPVSDPSSIVTPDTLSPLSVTKTGRHSKRSKHKLSKHYQESDIVDSPTMLYYKSGLGDKISDYEDVWTNEPAKTAKNNANNVLASPDLLQHTENAVSLNNNILSPGDPPNGSIVRSHCSSSSLNMNNKNSNSSSMSPPEQQCLTPLTADLSSPTNPKQGSPFYAEPADSVSNNLNNQIAVPRRLPTRVAPPIQQRHSNPPALHSLSPLSPALERIESIDLCGMSSSVDNLSPKQRFLGLKKPELKPVMPPFIKPRTKENWQVDPGWKFLTSECDLMDSSDQDYEAEWPTPTMPNFMSSLESYTPDSDNTVTLQDMITKRFPDIRTSAESTSMEVLCRMSSYDNVEDRIPRAPASVTSEMTEFSDPWTELSTGGVVSTNETDDSLTLIDIETPPKLPSIVKSKSFKERLDPLLSGTRIKMLRNRESNGSVTVGSAIREYSLELANDKSTTFAQNIDNFIACTRDSKEANPQIVMRNMRQFMSGMKNYLVKHGEKGFDKEIERERNKLKATEFLNLDAILEGVMHKLVVKPLKMHLEKLFLDHYTKTGAIRLLADNINYAFSRPASELAIKPKISLPSQSALSTISQYIQRLESADSPLEKLEYLLAAIATIFNSVKAGQLTGSGRAVPLGADDFLPLFVWVLVKTNFVTAEIQAEYMWGLLHPSLLSGEGGYYLTTLSSAIHVLKNFKESGNENPTNNVKNESVLKVVVPDELHGSILTKTLPAKPHMTTKDVCKIIAHKARITNPQDYALYRLTDGEETMLLDNECPQDFINQGRYTMLAYKRIDAKIAWPNQNKLNI